MGTLKSLLLLVAVSYVAVVALAYFMQRAMMYFPEKVRSSPEQAGFAEAEEVILDTADGERLIAWHVPPRGENPVLLYFHGNGGAIGYRVDRFRALTSVGFGLVALSYRGYGGSTGKPSEQGLLADAEAAYRFAVSRYPVKRLAVWGESLGSGVAVALASEKAVSRVVLEAPFASAVEIGAAAYPFLPVRWLMKDQFRSDLRAGKVRAPVLILHGERDAVVPIRSGERLYGLIDAPKRFVRFPDATHDDLAEYGAIEVATKFILSPQLTDREKD
jgi:uncharacterized protein